MMRWQHVLNNAPHNLKPFRQKFALPKAVVEIDMNERRLLGTRKVALNGGIWVFQPLPAPRCLIPPLA